MKWCCSCSLVMGLIQRVPLCMWLYPRMRAHPQNFYRFPVVKPSVLLWVQSEEKNRDQKKRIRFLWENFQNKIYGVRNMVQWEKHLTFKFEDQPSDIQNLFKNTVFGSWPVIPVICRKRQTIPGANYLASLVCDHWGGGGRETPQLRKKWLRRSFNISIWLPRAHGSHIYEHTYKQLERLYYTSETHRAYLNE